MRSGDSPTVIVPDTWPEKGKSPSITNGGMSKFFKGISVFPKYLV
jgi:hypothetical protein